MSIGKRIKEARAKLGVSQAVLAKSLNVSQAALGKWETDKSSPATKRLQELSFALHVSVDHLATGNESSELATFDNNVSPMTDKHGNIMKMRYLPVVSWVQAGGWCEAIDSHPVGEADEWIAIVGNVSEHAFALKIEGDSMTPEFRPGEYVAVEPARQPKNGSFVVAKLGDSNVATFKQLRFDAGRTYLKPLNRDYPMMDVTDKEDFKICGVVIQKVMQYD